MVSSSVRNVRRSTSLITPDRDRTLKISVHGVMIGEVSVDSYYLRGVLLLITELGDVTLEAHAE